MDIRTLPDHERMLYNTLKSKYSLHFKSLKVGGYNLRLLKPSKIEEILDSRDPHTDAASFPFWAKLWEASVVLAHLLASGPGSRGRRLLELGAGLGLAGIAASVAGYDAVLSDNEQVILDFQRVSAAASGSQGAEHILLDWFKPQDIGSFDVIGGAEILSGEEFLDPLLDICKNCLADGGTVYLAHDVRRKCLPIFLRRAEADFYVGSQKRSVQTSGATVDILVNRLQRR